MSHADLWPPAGDDPPKRHTYAAAQWLCSRHPQVAGLAARVRIVSQRGDLAPDLDLEPLAEAFTVRDEHDEAWARYRRRVPPPDDDTAYDDWEAAGPPYPDTPAGRVAQLLGPMSSTEVARLRLLAMFCDQARVPVRVADVFGLDGAGGRYLVDVFRAWQAQR